MTLQTSFSSEQQPANRTDAAAAATSAAGGAAAALRAVVCQSLVAVGLHRSSAMSDWSTVHGRRPRPTRNECECLQMIAAGQWLED